MGTDCNDSLEVNPAGTLDRVLAAGTFCHTVVSLSWDSVMTSIISLKNANLLILAHVHQREENLSCWIGAKSHILHFFNESSLVWQTDAFGLLLLWWWVGALYGACFHGVVFCWPNLNSAGPIYTEPLPTQGGIFEWSVYVCGFTVKNPAALFTGNERFLPKNYSWYYLNTKLLLWARQ